jgi:hypothetical protein
MSAISAVRRPAVVIAISVLLFVSAVATRAETIYVLDPAQATQPDEVAPGGDDILGATFHVSGNVITSVDYSVTSVGGTVYSSTATASSGIIQQGLVFKDFEGVPCLELSRPGYLQFQTGPLYIDGSPDSADWSRLTMLWRYDPYENGNLFSGYPDHSTWPYTFPYPNDARWNGFTGYSSTPHGIRTDGDNWVIGVAVPEPASLLLLVTAIVAFGGMLVVHPFGVR